MSDYRTGSVTSADGTVIGYRVLGSGPPIIALHGGMLAAQHLVPLAEALADSFTVYLPDRRGRGLSGPAGGGYGMAREVEDLRALVAATGAVRAFGLSCGALVVLRTALDTPTLTRIALYEPPLSVAGSAPLGWVPRFERELAGNRIPAALTTVLKGLGTEPMFGRVPRAVLVPVMSLGSRLRRAAPGDDVPVTALVPTMRQDIRLIREMADTAGDYATVRARVLLLTGDRSPGYFDVATNALSAVLPDSGRTTLPGLGHSGPTDDGDPRRVAEAVRGFFTTG
jgi:pimeloyl-ACP methyl ester carboxylesterase